jgi:hypothetical protein
LRRHRRAERPIHEPEAHVRFRRVSDRPSAGHRGRHRGPDHFRDALPAMAHLGTYNQSNSFALRPTRFRSLQDILALHL